MNLAALGWLARASFLDMMAYRLRYYTGIATYTVYVAVYSAIWAASRSAGNAAGYEAHDFATFVAVGYILRSSIFSDLDWDVAGQVQDGSLATDLLKPLDYPMMHMARAAGAACFRLFLFSAPIAVVILGVFDVAPPAGPVWAVLLSALMAFWIFAQVSFLIGLCAIPFHSVQGLIRLKHHALNILTGLVIPLSLFPESLRKIIQWLPFPHMSHTPVMLYMGRLSELGVSTPGEALFRQGLWALGSTVAVRVAWHAAQKRITIHGG